MTLHPSQVRRLVSKNWHYFLIKLVPLTLQDYNIATMSIPKRDGVGSYLCLPCLIGKPKKGNFPIYQRPSLEKLNGWKEKILLLASKVVLIKDIVQAISI